MTDYISREEVLEHSEYTENFNLVVPVRFIKAMKAADVQPVKRGRWIISNLYAQCSECSVAYDLDTFQRLIPMNENVPRHCSYCGARMDLIWRLKEAKTFEMYSPWHIVSRRTGTTRHYG